MKIRTLRDYSGEEGTGVDRNVSAGTEYSVTRARGNALKAVGLAEILEDEADDETEVTMQDEQQIEPIKSQPKPSNKQAPDPVNKVAPATDDKLTA